MTYLSNQSKYKSYFISSSKQIYGDYSSAHDFNTQMSIMVMVTKASLFEDSIYQMSLEIK